MSVKSMCAISSNTEVIFIARYCFRPPSYHNCEIIREVEQVHFRDPKNKR